MRDRGIWILGGLIVIALVATYFVNQPQRSRPKAASSAAATTYGGKPFPASGILHVEGCRQDFHFSPGHPIEPRVAPGSSIEEFRSVYGKESDEEDPGVYTWDPPDYELIATMPNATEPDSSVQIAMNNDHPLRTLDGIDLGSDTFGTIFRKMHDRKIDVHERIWHHGDSWVFIVSMYSACGAQFRSKYFLTVPDNPENHRQIDPTSSSQGTSRSLRHSDFFMNKAPYDYILQTSFGKDDATDGEPSQHLEPDVKSDTQKN